MISAEGLRRGAHDWTSAEYVDSWLQGAQTREAERGLHFWLMCRLLPFGPNDTFAFGDLGAGGGALAAAVLDAFPNSRAVCIDGSEAMLARAAENLGRHEGRVELLQTDFSRAGWSKPLAGRQLEAMVSYQAIHNLFDAAAIRRVYRESCGLLAPGAVFLTGDNIASSAPLQPLIDAAYRARRAQRDGDTRPPAAAESDTGSRFAGTLEQHLAWLRKAGFSASECPWRELQRAILMARK